MLDEIINYVQSLQNQVEVTSIFSSCFVVIIYYLKCINIYTNKLHALYFFQFLSMKLTSVNPMFYDMATDLDTLLVRQEVSKKN